MELETLAENYADYLTPMLEQLSAMDQAGTQKRMAQVAPELLRAIARFARAESAAMYRKKEPGTECYMPVTTWEREKIFPQEIDMKGQTERLERFHEQDVIVYDTEEFPAGDRAGFPFYGKKLKMAVILPILIQNVLCGFLQLNYETRPFDRRLSQVLHSVANHWGAISVSTITNMLLKQQQESLEEALRAERKYSEIFSALSKVYWQIFSVDLRTDTYIEIYNGLNFNKDSHLKSGGIASEAFSTSLNRFVADEYKDALLEFLRHSTLAERLASTQTISMEYQAQNGMWLSARYIVQSRDADGTVTEALFAIRSVNEHKQKELAYQSKLEKTAEEAKRANIAKKNFLRRMSHDVRTPINGIKGLIEIAEENPLDMEIQKDCRGKVKTAVGYLLDLLNSVLDMSKLESGEVKPENKPFDLKELLDRCTVIVRPQCIENGISFVQGDDPLPHRQLIGSPTYLQQILLNLASNAVKYNKLHGTVYVSCRETDCTDEKVEYEFVCQDTGIGMSKEYQKHLFEPFTQENAAARTQYHGTGLGMAIVKELVDLHGGTITVESVQGEGTTVRVRLPFRIDAAASTTAPAGTPEEKCSIAGLHILLVEDNELNMDIAAYLLQNQGAVLTKAWNGQEAVETFQQSAPDSFDLILMDIMMPVMGGWEATRRIRALHRPDAAEVPIIAMTANAFADDAQKCIDVGMDAHLSKPFEIKTVIKTICQCIRRI